MSEFSPMSEFSQPAQDAASAFSPSPSELKEIEHWSKLPPVAIAMPRMELLAVIANLQLALKHPENAGWNAKVARNWIGQIRAHIAEPGSYVDNIISMGFDPAFDVPVTDAPGTDAPAEEKEKTDV